MKETNFLNLFVHMFGCVVLFTGLALGGIMVTDYQWWVSFIGLAIVYFNA